MWKVVAVVVKFKISRSRNKVLLRQKPFRQPWWWAVRRPEAPACGCGKTLYPSLQVICGSLRSAVSTALSAGSQGWRWNFLVPVRMFAPAQRCPLAQKAWCQERTHQRALRSGRGMCPFSHPWAEALEWAAWQRLMELQPRSNLTPTGNPVHAGCLEGMHVPWTGFMINRKLLKKAFLFHLMLVEVFKSLGLTYLFCNVIKNGFQSFF